MSFEDSVKDMMDSIISDASETTEKPAYNNPLYKKWFKSKTQSGFLAIKPWFDGMKFLIDIGKTSNEGKLESSTACYVEAADFAAYLKCIVSGTAENVYPASEKLGIPYPESFISYGGSIINGNPVSRIFKAQYWPAGENVDKSSFIWKSGHFKARKTDIGALIPDMKSPLSVDSIRVSRKDISTISYMLDMAMYSHVANNTDWYTK